MTSRLRILPAHQALFLVKNCLGIPKMMYVLRCSPTFRCPAALAKWDETMRVALCCLTNTQLTADLWIQASLPVSKGGLGIRRVTDIALPAYLASVHRSRMLTEQIVPEIEYDPLAEEVAAKWSAEVNADMPILEERWIQKRWDERATQQILDGLMGRANMTDRARLLAVTSSDSGQWLNALPVASVGNLLDDDSLRIAVAIRLGADVCEEHTCRCGATVDRKGHHGLSCKYSAGRHGRHGAINQVVQRALSTIGSHAVLEPPGLDRGDGKRPDGMTRVPWAHGKQVIWDVTVVDTVARSYLNATSTRRAAAAIKAEERKTDKYKRLTERYIFMPIAIETFGSIGPLGMEFLCAVGKKLIRHTGDKRSSQFLQQRISIELQKGNSLCVLGTLPSSTELEEIFYTFGCK